MSEQDYFQDIAKSLQGIEAILEAILQQSADKSPNFRYQFDEYPSFDWQSIGGQPMAHDQYGVTRVKWGGYANWYRRFAPAKGTRKASIWFSRAAATEDADAGAEWFTLVTFRDLTEAEPLPAGAITPHNPQPAPPPVSKTKAAAATSATPSPFFRQGDKVRATDANGITHNGVVTGNGEDGTVSVKLGKKIYRLEAAKVQMAAMV